MGRHAVLCCAGWGLGVGLHPGCSWMGQVPLYRDCASATRAVPPGLPHYLLAGSRRARRGGQVVRPDQWPEDHHPQVEARAAWALWMRQSASAPFQLPKSISHALACHGVPCPLLVCSPSPSVAAPPAPRLRIARRIGLRTPSPALLTFLHAPALPPPPAARPLPSPPRPCSHATCSGADTLTVELSAGAVSIKAAKSTAKVAVPDVSVNFGK